MDALDKSEKEEKKDFLWSEFLQGSKLYEQYCYYTQMQVIIDEMLHTYDAITNVKG